VSVPAVIVERDVADALYKLYLATSLAATENVAIGYAPVNARLACPSTMSPATIPVAVNVPVEFDVAVVIVPSVVAPIVVDPKLAFVMLGPDNPPISSVPTVTSPVLLIVVEAIVPIVAVPVEAVKLVPNVAGPDANSVPIVAVPVDIVTLVPNVTGPSWRGIVAVLIVAVLMLAVAIVVVPVDAVMLDPNVVIPKSLDAPSTANVPVLFTPVVDICSAETPASLPLATAASVGPTISLPNVFRTWL
jgi:hypothetical protein